MGPSISKTENSISELEVDMENDNTLDITSKYGLCPECNNRYLFWDEWCNQCLAERFQQDFPNWTSGNIYIDNFIQQTQLNAQNKYEVLEWIPYDRLTNIEYLAKGGFSTVYKAIWLDGRIEKWDHDKNEWIRHKREYYDDNGSKIEGNEVAIKNLDNSSNINDEFLNEVNKFF